MRVLLTSLAHSTHWHPLIPMAWALRTAGHEVRVASLPELTDTITECGLTAVPIDAPGWSIDDAPAVAILERIHEESFTYLRDFDFTGRDRGQWTWERLVGLEEIVVPAHNAVMNKDALLDELVAFARSWRPDLVIWETYTQAGAIAAAAVGAAHARFISGPDVTMRVRQEFLRQARARPVEHREDPTAEWLGWTLDRLGCDAGFSEELVTGQWTIDSTAASTRLDLGLPTVPVRFVPYNGPAVVPDWLRKPAERPRVCLTFGVSEWITAFIDGAAITNLLEALAELDLEIIATLNAGQRAQLGTVPDNARVVDFVPLNDLLPTCSVVVHHGGIGTKATAELHGVPQIILAFGMDTAVMGDRLEELGAGLSMPVTDLTGAALREKVVRVVNERSFAEGARRIQREMRETRSPNDVVPEIEKLTAQRRR